MADGNPFAAPMGSSYQPSQQPEAFGASQNGGNPFGNPQQQQQQQIGYGQQPPPPVPHAQQQPPMQQGQPGGNQPPQQQSYDIFASVSQPLPPQHQQYNNALVPSQQQTNPYAGMVAPAPPPGNDQLVPHQPAHQLNQYSAASTSYDPFAAPHPATAQALVPASPTEATPYPGAPPYQQQQQFQEAPQNFGPPATIQQQQHPLPQQHQQQSQPPPQQEEPSPPVQDIVPAPSSGYPNAPRTPSQAPPPDKESQTPTGMEARNKYSSALAQNAPLGASPLPRADMVRKTGYVLSRISFRTIVMKKWKQSFWVQYGPHTMLWFRSQSDFDDWLNNPYHTQAQRNFLIKLAVNFAHDLYKPNVRGYQVTQCRTKAYGTKLIRQFKLERWMDYGPTIAAAFGSNNPKEVDDLREALVACMRNTPLNGGIRATGAVRERSHEGQGHENGGERRGHHLDHAASYGGHANVGQSGSRSVVSASDMLNDQKGFDDDAHSLGGIPTGEAPDLLDFSEPPTQAPTQQPNPYPQQQQQFASQGSQMQPNPYGQPMQTPQQQQMKPPQQYPGAAPPGYPMQQQQFGANPQMQQQFPPQGQPQAFGGY